MASKGYDRLLLCIGWSEPFLTAHHIVLKYHVLAHIFLSQRNLIVDLNCSEELLHRSSDIPHPHLHILFLGLVLNNIVDEIAINKCTLKHVQGV